MSNRQIAVFRLFAVVILIAMTWHGAFALAADAPVTITQDDQGFTLSNGIITARVSKNVGDLTSMVFNGVETMYVPGPAGGGGGHPWGYWEQTPGRNTRNVNSVTIDPSTNGGERGEVSVKGYYNATGGQLGQGAPGGGATCDIELRYCLGPGGERCVFHSYLHPPSFNAGRGHW